MKVGMNARTDNFASPLDYEKSQRSHGKSLSHNFSPHRKLTSARKNVQQFDIDNCGIDDEIISKENKLKKEKG